MNIEEVQKILQDIQNSTFETKILSLILNLYQEQNKIKEVLNEYQGKINDIIIEVNALIEQEKEKKEKELKENDDIK